MENLKKLSTLGCPSLFYEIQQGLSGVLSSYSPKPHLPMQSTEPVLILSPTAPLSGPFQFEAAHTPFFYEECFTLIWTNGFK